MADKITSTIVATSLLSVVGFCGGTQLIETVKTPQIQDPKEIIATPLVLDPVCISAQEDFNPLSEYKTGSEDYYFTCEEILSFKEYGGTLEYAKELASLKNNEGKPFFTGYDIVAFKHAGGTAEYARKFVYAVNADGRPFSGSQLPQFYKLGLDLHEIITFTDTSKPNALIIYPTHDGELPPKPRDKDYVDNYGAFRTAFALKFFHELQNAYDLKVRVSSVEDEVYDALKESKGFMFFMPTGHGGEKTLSLGENDLRTMQAEKDERYTLDTSDSELEQYLQNLDPKATIFLNSCSNGKGGPGADNLANAMAGWAKGRKVIAAQDDLWTHRITDFHPNSFDVILLDKSGEKDITYRTSISP
ncbi:MAG: hypothetical protein Q7S55_00160 [Nanoarchaeota archaeon]|nr:hypothetical protein [Nanoarchaeota archaeon]